MTIDIKGHSGCNIDIVEENDQLFVKKSTQDKNYCNRSCQFKHNQSKMLKTMKEKYGAEYAAQSKECRAKMEATCVKRHGVRSCWWTEEGKRKAYEQNQRPESKKIRYEHMRQTNLEKYSIK